MTCPFVGIKEGKECVSEKWVGGDFEEDEVVVAEGRQADIQRKGTLPIIEAF